MKILIDLDNIAVDLLPYWLMKIQTNTGVVAEIKDIIHWDLHRCPPLDSIVDKAAVYSRLQDPGFFEYAPPMAGVAEGVRRLMDAGHEVYVVTARHGAQSMPETMRWIATHLPFVKERQVIFCYDKHLIPADILIDDKPENIEMYRAAWPKATTITIEYPYNVNTVVSKRVPYGALAWGIIVEYIESLEKTRYDRVTMDELRGTTGG